MSPISKNATIKQFVHGGDVRAAGMPPAAKAMSCVGVGVQADFVKSLPLHSVRSEYIYRKMAPHRLPRPDVSTSGVPTRPVPLALVRDEHELVQRIRHGDREAYRMVFEAYYEPLCAFAAYYVESLAAAEELVQDVFAWVWVERSRWTVRESLQTYLFGAVRNRALNVRRSAKRQAHWADRAQLEAVAPGQSQGSPPADEALRLHELGIAIEQAVAKLPERRRQAFLLRWQYHLSNAEIARVMGISVKGVEMALVHAFRTLRSQLANFF